MFMIWLRATKSFLWVLLALLVALGLCSGSGRLRDSVSNFLHMSMLDSFMRATGRLDVRRALAVLKLLLSMAIWAERDISRGEVVCSLIGLIFTVLDIWNNFSICPDLNNHMRS